MSDNSEYYLKNLPVQVRALSERITDAVLLGAFTATDTAHRERFNGDRPAELRVPGLGMIPSANVSVVWGWLVDLVKSRHTDEWKALSDAQDDQMAADAAKAQGVPRDQVDWDLIPDEIFDNRASALDFAVLVLTQHVAFDTQAVR